MLNPKVRAFLEKNGLKKGASDAEARGLLVALKARGIEPVDPIDIDDPQGGQRSAGGVVPTAGNNQGTTAGDDNERSAAVIAEQERLDMINLHLRAYPAAEPLRAELVRDASYTGGKIRQAVADFVSGSSRKMEGSFGGASVATVGTDAWDHQRSAIVDSLLMRMGYAATTADAFGIVKKRQYHEQALVYQGRTLLEIGGIMLRSQGLNPDNMARSEIVERLLTRSAQTFFDFPLLLGEYINKALQSLESSISREWLPTVKEVSVTDFKTRHPMQLGQSNKFGLRQEGGRFPQATYKESGESYRAFVYGLMCQLTMEMLIGDDLNAFGQQAMDFQQAQLLNERDLYYGQLTSGALMSDGKPLFHADHNNISTVDAVRGDSASFDAALEAAELRGAEQVTATGVEVDVEHEIVLCDSKDYRMLYKKCTEPRISLDGDPIGQANPDAGKTVIKGRPITLAFYLFANPNKHPVIEAAWLNGRKDVNFFSQPHYAGLHVEYTGWSGVGFGTVGYHGVDRTTVVLPTP